MCLIVQSMQEEILISESKLTALEASALAGIHRLIAVMGIPPSLSEIADELKCSGSTALNYVVALERAGYVARTPGKNRSIRLTVKSGEFMREVA